MCNICFSDSAKHLLNFCLGARCISFLDDLSIGRISSLKIGDFERRIRHTLLTMHMDPDMYPLLFDAYHALFQVGNEQSVVVWCGPSPYEICGMLYANWLLPSSIQFSVVALPPESQSLSIGEVSPEHIQQLLRDKKMLKPEERNMLKDCWEELMRADAALRIFKDGRIRSADISYYDRFLVDSLPYKYTSIYAVLWRALLSISGLGMGRVQDRLLMIRLVALLKRNIILMRHHATNNTVFIKRRKRG